MKKIILTIISGVALSLLMVHAQQKGANISFDESSFDFGTIEEANGTVTHRFGFTNTGSEALIIQNVGTSCGCTTPEWTKTPVRPGEKGFVSASYNPADRPGQFEKYITVQSTAKPPVVQLTIKGKVNQKPLTLEEQYPFAFGGIRMKSNQVSYGTIYKGQENTSILEIINASNVPQTIKVDGLPPHIRVNIPKATLSPKQTGIIEVSFNSALKDDWGFVIDRINVLVNNQSNINYRIIVSANIDENFSNLTAEQRANAPVISFDNTSFDFGSLKNGTSASHEYMFTNKGKSNLIIRKVTASCGCTATMISDQVVAPGKSGVIKTVFDSSGKTGKQNKTITVITNDPKSPRVILWVRGEVLAAAN